MSARTHLSIGEVLSLLTDDFPDLTITKIRFLESQGLIDPERTASGYRKFYDFDIERLRWILRQQRENFLPLKVIKDRLDRSDGKLPDDEPGSGQAELDLARDPGASDPPPIWMSDHAESTRSTGGSARSDAGGEPPAEPPTAPVGNDAGSSPAAGSPAASADEDGDAPKASAKPPPKSAAKPKSGSKAKSKKAKSQNTPETGDRTRTGTPSPETEPAMPTHPVPEVDPTQNLSDVSMTRAELLGASGLTERQLSELESYRIVEPADGLDDEIYGAEALVCARQAAIFMDLGMEPRHLRAFKVAADREAGMYEQLILPLLRQRNPAARAEATQTVKRLAAAGATLHAALLQQSLRAQLRPGR